MQQIDLSLQVITRKCLDQIVCKHMTLEMDVSLGVGTRKPTANALDCDTASMYPELYVSSSYYFDWVFQGIRKKLLCHTSISSPKQVKVIQNIRYEV
jgi:hypothetical protein